MWLAVKLQREEQGSWTELDNNVLKVLTLSDGWGNKE